MGLHNPGPSNQLNLAQQNQTSPSPSDQINSAQQHLPLSSSSRTENDSATAPFSPSTSSSMGPPRSDFHPSSTNTRPTQVLSPNSTSPSPSTTSEPTAHSQNESQTSTQSNPTSNEPTAPRQNVLQPTTQNQSQTNPRTPHQAALSQPQNQIVAPPQNLHNMQTRAKNNIRKPKHKHSLTVTANLQFIKEPTTIHQALKDEKWSRACSSEFDALAVNQTWDLVPPETRQNIIGCRWVFTTKFLANGQLDRYKARLAAKGFHQQYGKDYAETFSPVIKSTTIRLVLDVAVAKNWPLKQLDVNNAFLQGELTEEVYMSQPPGFVDKDRPSYVCRLKKPIYGLKQAPRAWYMALKQFLLVTGFTNSLADTTLFVNSSANIITYVLVYVDDIIVTGNNNRIVANVLISLFCRTILD